MYKAVSLPRRRHYTAVSVSVSVDYYYFSALWLWLDMSVAAAAAAATAVVVATKIVSPGTLTICRLEVFDGYVRIYIHIYQSLVSLKCAIAKVCLCTRAKRHNEFKSQEAQQQQ